MPAINEGPGVRVVNIEAKLYQLSLQNTRTEVFWIMDLLNNLTVEEDLWGHHF
jgi:hypothetical protein